MVRLQEQLGGCGWHLKSSKFVVHSGTVSWILVTISQHVECMARVGTVRWLWVAFEVLANDDILEGALLLVELELVLELVVVVVFVVAVVVAVVFVCGCSVHVVVGGT